MQRSIVCEACRVFEPILSINHQCTKKHKARVFIIRYCINCQNFLGGKLECLGGKLPPPHPPVDETLGGHISGVLIRWSSLILHHSYLQLSFYLHTKFQSLKVFYLAMPAGIKTSLF